MAITPAKTRALLKKIAGRRILVIGDVMLDHYVWGDATRISPEAPVPVVRLHRETDTVGGAANVAANVSSLGASVELVGAIGRDPNGKKLQSHLENLRIRYDPGFLRDSPTITKTRVIVRNQQLCRIDSEGDPPRYRNTLVAPGALALLEEKISRCDGVILSDYGKGVLTTAVISRIAELVRKYSKFISLDPKPSGGNESHDLDLLTPNRREAIELSGLKPGGDEEADEAKICAGIWKRYRPRNLVITLGSDGMLLCKNGVLGRHIPTAARQVYDVSGAGDTVIAAISLALVAGENLETSAHFSNAAAGVVVGKLGTATATIDELIAYVSHTP